MATSAAIQQEALTRAVSGQSLSNYAPIIRGFMAKGIPEDQIIPRVNVFSYNAWKANGRQVRKGEHGVKCLTFITKTGKNGREERRPWTVTVFHVSQTEAVDIRGNVIDAHISKQYVRVPTPTAPLELPEPDATPENIPYAGEEDTDEAELLDHSTAVHVNRQIEKFSPEATIETFTLDENCELVRETPEPPKTYTFPDSKFPSPVKPVKPLPPPKDSTYDRAMRGEQVSIMDIIAELPKPTPRHVPSFDRPFSRPGFPKTAKQDVVF
jgi:hypothetical protein